MDTLREQGDRRGINDQRDLDSSALPITHHCFCLESWPRSQKSLLPGFVFSGQREGPLRKAQTSTWVAWGESHLYGTPTAYQAFASCSSARFLRETSQDGCYRSPLTEEEVQRAEDTGITKAKSGLGFRSIQLLNYRKYRKWRKMLGDTVAETSKNKTVGKSTGEKSLVLLEKNKRNL